MSVQTLYTAATGMEALQTKLDVIANNLANVNTTAFKKGRANFEDLFYRKEMIPGAEDSAGNPTPTGTLIGLGTRVSSVQTDFRQGAFQLTGRNLDLAIEGQGFFQLNDPSGETVYTRAGNLSINANGQLVAGSANTGRVVEPQITIPQDATDIAISAEGIVSFRQQGSQDLQQAGQLNLAVFQNPEGLMKLGENLYSQTPASNSAIVAVPGQNGIGFIRQGASRGVECRAGAGADRPDHHATVV